MARHDLRCGICNVLVKNVTVSTYEIVNSVAETVECPNGCGRCCMTITWESGEAPKVMTLPPETIGSLWDKAGFDPMSKESKEASVRAIKQTQKDTLKRKKKRD